MTEPLPVPCRIQSWRGAGGWGHWVEIDLRETQQRGRLEVRVRWRLWDIGDDTMMGVEYVPKLWAKNCERQWFRHIILDLQLVEPENLSPRTGSYYQLCLGVDDRSESLSGILQLASHVYFLKSWKGSVGRIKKKHAHMWSFQTPSVPKCSPNTPHTSVFQVSKLSPARQESILAGWGGTDSGKHSQ